MRNRDFDNRCKSLPYVYDTHGDDPTKCITKKAYNPGNKGTAQCDHLLELQTIAQ